MIAFIIIMITIIAFSLSVGHDEVDTKNSKNNSKSEGRMTYLTYSNGGRTREPTLLSNGQKLRPGLNGNYYDKHGRIVFNLYEEQIKKANQYIRCCVSKYGWDWGPFIWDIKHNIWQRAFCSSTDSVPCIEFKTGKVFKIIIYGINQEKMIKVYQVKHKGADGHYYYKYSDEPTLDFELPKDFDNAKDFIETVNNIATNALQKGRHWR